MSRRQDRRDRGLPRTPMEFPVPQPTTPLSSNVIPLTFESWRLARDGIGDPVVLKLFRKFGGYKIKPKRGSVGVIWNNRAFWWSAKGYYRTGKDRGIRRPLQHLIWERRHGRKMPPRHEIYFTDRDRHNFSPENLELLSKADCHRRISAAGETRQPTEEVRCIARQRIWTRKAREGVSLLPKNFQSGGDKVRFLAGRKQTFNHPPKI